MSTLFQIVSYFINHPAQTAAHLAGKITYIDISFAVMELQALNIFG
jgi:hypothetical protein